MAKQDKPRQKQKESQAQPQYSTLREYFVTIVLCTIVALFLTTYVVHPMSVPTPSMEPTILVGDRVLVDKFTFRNGFETGLPLTPVETVERQDIIVCKSPLQPDILLVKRVVGIPGDTFEIRNKAVHIDGEPLEEPYKQHSDPRVYSSGGQASLQLGLRRDNYGPITIPAEHYFVMGDNRDDSLDSRYWKFLPARNIVGKPVIIFWSYEDPPDAHLRTSVFELVELYAKRIVFFITRTRWSRMGRPLQ